jgi:hypothetical protein
MLFNIETLLCEETLRREQGQILDTNEHYDNELGVFGARKMRRHENECRRDGSQQTLHDFRNSYCR